MNLLLNLVTFEHPVAFLLLAFVPVLLAVWLWRGRRIIPPALLLRTISLSLLILALANPILGTPPAPAGTLVLLVDQSDSLTEAGKQTLREQAAQLAATLEQTGQSDQTTILWFGKQAVAPGAALTTDPSLPAPPELLAAINPNYTDLGAALRTARELLTDVVGDALPGARIILLSDGQQTSGDALGEARLSASRNIPVDVVPIAAVPATDLRIVDVTAPQRLNLGEEFTVQIAVVNDAAPTQVPARLRLWANERVLGNEDVVLDPGLNEFEFQSRANDAGVLRLRAEISGSPDTFGQNNRAGAAITVLPPPRVLIVEGKPGAAAELTPTLWNTGIESEVIQPNQLSFRMADLLGYAGMILLDVPGTALTLDQMATVREFVRSEGRGLVVAGGSNSYGLGAYEGTPLEQALPVTMEAPPRPERSSVALLLIVDRSASMDAAIGISKFAMAKEAAILAIETLQPNDSVGVLAFDTGQQWTVPFQQVGEGTTRQAIKDRIAAMPIGGGTDIYGALAAGLRDLEQQTNGVRHVVLLSDGRSFTNDQNAYRQLVDRAVQQNISISTIAIGLDSDIVLMENLARWGNGRYYFTNTAEDIPRLTLQESEIARADPSMEGAFQPELVAPHPLVRDFAPAALPQLNGYVATTAKDTGEIVLQSPDGDPVLAAWQYGLGRAVAWTPTIGAPWSREWVGWEDYGRYWAQIVRYTLPKGEQSPIRIQLTPQDGGVRLNAQVVQANGTPLNLATTQARVVLPDGSDRIFTLLQDGPGSYSQDILLPESGAYGIDVALERDGVQYRTTTGYVQPVSAEFLPPRPDDIPGDVLLQELATITAGQVLDAEQLAAMLATQQENAAATPSPLAPVWVWLVAAALLVWLLEIAVRRGLFSRE